MEGSPQRRQQRFRESAHRHTLSPPRSPPSNLRPQLPPRPANRESSLLTTYWSGGLISTFLEPTPILAQGPSCVFRVHDNQGLRCFPRGCNIHPEVDTTRRGGATTSLGCRNTSLGGAERERDNRLRALRATRPQTVGYIGGCDQEQGGVESPL